MVSEPFKFTDTEIEEMEKMITGFSDDSRKPFLCGTEKSIKEVEFNGRKYVISLSIEADDDTEDEDEKDYSDMYSCDF